MIVLHKSQISKKHVWKHACCELIIAEVEEQEGDDDKDESKRNTDNDEEIEIKTVEAVNVFNNLYIYDLSRVLHNVCL